MSVAEPDASPAEPTVGAAGPSSPAGARLAWLIELVTGSPAAAAATAAHLAPRLLAADSDGPLRPLVQELADSGGAERVDRVDARAGLEASARLWARDGTVWTLRCAVDPAPPHRVVAAALIPARRPSDEGCSVPVPWHDIADDDPVASGTLGESIDAVLTDTARRLRAELRLPGLVAAVVAGGRLAHWVRAGYAEVATRRRPSRRMAIRLGSLSAVPTALVVDDLIATGRIALDAPVTSLLPSPALDTPGGSRPVRIGDLLTHTAGLPVDSRLPLAVAGDCALPDPADVLGERLALDAPVGTRFGYTPVGYALLGRVVEQVTGRPFEDAAADSLDALGARHTSYRLDDRVAKQPFCAHDVDADEVMVALASQPVFAAAAGAAGTLDDLALLAGTLARTPRLTTAIAGTGIPGIGVSAAGLFTASTALAWSVGGWLGALAGLWVGDGVGVVLAANVYSVARLLAVEQAGAELLADVRDRLTA